MVQAGRLRFDSWQGLEFFLPATASRPAEAHPASYPMHTKEKAAGREAEFLPPCGAQEKWSFTSIPSIYLHAVLLS
jgi:hypothetical protein